MLFGGEVNEKYFYSFNPSNQQRTKLPDLLNDRSYHGSVVIRDSVFIVGGVDNKTIEEYDISTKTFKNIVTMKNYRRSFGICVFNRTEVLIAGGRGDYNTVINNCFLFNTNTKTFKKVGNMLSKKYGNVLVKVDGIVYSIGGRNDREKYLNTIETFDPVTEQWKISDVKLHIARDHHQAVVHKHFIYIFGGSCEDKFGGPNEHTDTIEKYNLLTGQIELLDEKLRVGRSDFAVGKINSDVYIFGGLTRNGKRTASCEIFNLETEEIREGENLPFSDFCVTACVV